jgi:hypothetical protein
MAMNAGIVAIGSTITNSELSANKQYASRFMFFYDSRTAHASLRVKRRTRGHFNVPRQVVE